MNHYKEMLRKCKALNRIYTKIKWRARRVHYGKANPDKIFYVIRRHDIHAGLFSYAATNLGSAVAAADKGYIPVVDMMNYRNTMLLPEQVGEVNAWEYYFEQPMQYTMKDVYDSRNVILGEITQPEHFPDFGMLSDPEELQKWQEMAHKYLRLCPEVKARIQRYYEEQFGDRRVLGVLCRGTDYLLLKPHGHPIQPMPEEVIRKCREIMEKQQCDCIYLATEDQSIYELFEQNFPGKIYTYQKNRYEMQKAGYLNDVVGDQITPYERSLEYLVSIGILARCNCLIAGAVSGTYGALLLTEGYEYQYVYQLGRYE